MLIAIDDVGFGGLFEFRIKQDIFDNVLDLFDAWYALGVACFELCDDFVCQFFRLRAIKFACFESGFFNCSFDLFAIKRNLASITFFDCFVHLPLLDVF